MIKLYSNESLLTAIELALKHKLYVPGWELKNTLEGSIDFIKESLEDGDEINIHIALFFEQNTPVGIIFTRTFDMETQFFVKENFRRKGIATALSHEIYKIIGEPLNVYQGSDASYHFYQTLDFLQEH